MLEVLDKRILLLILSLLTNMETTKLSDQKKCGDPECETAMSRVQAVRDHLGPDCRFLSFKTGEEIMVHFKLSRTREDLWAGSKGQDFGYFPVDAIRVEEVLTAKEVEVPTKETDFFCLDGEEHIFENEDRIFSPYGEDEEVPLDTDEGGSEFAARTPRDLPFRTEFQEPSSGRGEVDSTVGRASYGDLERGSRQAAQEETTRPGHAGSQRLGAAPTPPAWTVSRIAGWLGLGSRQREGTAGKASEAAEPLLSRRKSAMTDGGELKMSNGEGGTGPGQSGWLQGHLPDFLSPESETSGPGLLHRGDDAEVRDGASETGKEEPCDSEAPNQNWFRLDLQDVLTFGYSSDNEARGGKAAGRGAADPKEELRPLSPQLTDRPEGEASRKPGVEPALQGAPHTAGQEAPGPEAAPAPASEEPSARPQADAAQEAAGPSLPTEPPDKLPQSQFAEQDSASDSHVMESVMKESGGKTDQSEGHINSKTQEDNVEESDKEKEPLDVKNKEKGLLDPTKEDFLVHDYEGDEQKSATADDEGAAPEEPRCDGPSAGHGRPPAGAAEDGREAAPRRSRSGRENGTAGPGRGGPPPAVLRLDALRDLLLAAALLATTPLRQAVAALPENMRPAPDLYGFPWEMAVLGAALACLSVLVLTCRSFRSVRSRLYAGREKQLASRVAELVEDKCKVLEKLSLCKQEFEDLENSLKDVNLLKGLTTTSDIKTVHKKLISANSALKNEIECLEKELEEEKLKRLEQDDLLGEIQKRTESLENEVRAIELQVAEAKTTLKVYEINRERLAKSVQDAAAENGHLQEREKQLLQEAEGWGERFGELSEQKKMFESSKGDLEEALKNKESQLKSLTECLLKMKDWSSATGEHDAAEGNSYHHDRNAESENGERVDDQEKRTVRKLIHAAKLSACLKSLETERGQIHSKLTDENQAKKELAGRIENLKKEHATLQSENAHSEREVQKLQQKLKVMTELYQENEMNLHRKLTVEEKERLQKEEKLSKADEKISHAAEELNAYRERAKDLEEELERTVRSYQSQIMSHEKKAHDNWLTARAAERFLSDMRKENSNNRQKLTEAEFKYDLLEKDPHALDVPVRPFVREHSPYGPSAMGRPSSETRAFLSPPTLLEGPLRFSPVLLGGGGRGSRGPGGAGSERGELDSDRLPDPHRPPSDTGSLSPPWDRDRRILPPPAAGSTDTRRHLHMSVSICNIMRNARGEGLICTSVTWQGSLMMSLLFEDSIPTLLTLAGFQDQQTSEVTAGIPLRKQVGIAAFFMYGRVSENNARLDLSGNGIKDHLDESNLLPVSDQPLPPENESFGPGVVPPPLPLLRAPLMPVDPRGPLLRRGPPFPPVPPCTLYGPRDYFPRDFASVAHPPLPAVRGPAPVRPFSHHPPPRAGFFPPPPPPPDNRNELPSEFTQPPTVSSTDNQESHKDT
ncbi:hypothetical protein lerEdw1_004882 [Lerista edwardsae]|nr:hypothetical protein lerEdw1_004882 [Lerista edwardsae]